MFFLKKSAELSLFRRQRNRLKSVSVATISRPYFAFQYSLSFCFAFNKKCDFEQVLPGELRTNIATRSLFFKVPDFDSRQIQFSLFSRCIEDLKSPSPISPYLRLVLISCLDAISNKASFGKYCSTLPSPSKFLVLLTGNLRLAESSVR